MSRDLTSRQFDVLQLMKDFLQEEDRMPSTREIQKHFGWASQSAAVSHQRALARKGYIEHRYSLKNPKGWYRLTRY